MYKRQPFRGSGADRRAQWWPAVTAVCALLAVCLLGVVIALWSLASGRDAASRPPVTQPVRLQWACSATTGLGVRCEGPVGPGISAWHWSFDDQPAEALGPGVDHEFPTPGVHQVSLVVSTPDGSRSAGSRSVVIPSPMTTTTATTTPAAPAQPKPRGARSGAGPGGA